LTQACLSEDGCWQDIIHSIMLCIQVGGSL
jgi:hypothetical protein